MTAPSWDTPSSISCRASHHSRSIFLRWCVTMLLRGSLLTAALACASAASVSPTHRLDSELNAEADVEAQYGKRRGSSSPPPSPPPPMACQYYACSSYVVQQQCVDKCCACLDDDSCAETAPGCNAPLVGGLSVAGKQLRHHAAGAEDSWDVSTTHLRPKHAGKKVDSSEDTPDEGHSGGWVPDWMKPGSKHTASLQQVSQQSGGVKAALAGSGGQYVPVPVASPQPLVDASPNCHQYPCSSHVMQQQCLGAPPRAHAQTLARRLRTRADAVPVAVAVPAPVCARVRARGAADACGAPRRAAAPRGRDVLPVPQPGRGLPADVCGLLPADWRERHGHGAEERHGHGAEEGARSDATRARRG